MKLALVRQCIWLILLVALMITSGSVVGCHQSQNPGTTLPGDKANWTEKQVIEYLYAYLQGKADQLQGTSYGEMTMVYLAFSKALMDAEVQAVKEDDLRKLGEFMTIQLGGWAPGSACTSSLQRLAKYNGDGQWSVSMGDRDWQVNEKTGEVAAQNEKAATTIELFTLKTYHNRKYGYYVDIPLSWQVEDSDESRVKIHPLGDRQDIAYIAIYVVDKRTLTRFGDLEGWVRQLPDMLRSLLYEFELVSQTSTGLTYTYTPFKDYPEREGRVYFVELDRVLYEIDTTAELTIFQSHGVSNRLYQTNLFDPITSFRSQP